MVLGRVAVGLVRELAAVGVVLGRVAVAVAVALVREPAAVEAALVRKRRRRSVAVVVALVLVHELAVARSVLVRKHAAVAMGMVAAASIEPAARQRRHSSGYHRDPPVSTPGSRMKYQRYGYSPLSVPSAVAAAPMEPAEARACQR